MNLASGSNRELFDFLSHCDRSDKIEAICVDADPDALEFTACHVDVLPHHATVRLMNDNVIKWALGRVRNKYGLQDIIYTAGLTDYLNRRLFLKLLTRCYEHLKPGGVLIVSNFSPDNPHRAFMDHILHWKLIYRDREELISLFGNSPFGRDINIVAEAQGINLFAIAKKKE
jgi:SAM-dependent methyltransferase